jgi:hypothetical protein
MLLIVLALAGCGQPLQTGTPSQVQVRPTRLPSDTVLPSVTANYVPSVLPSVQTTPELTATLQAEPTVGVAATEAATSTALISATSTPALIIVPLTQTPETNEQRWRAQEQARKINDPPRLYSAVKPTILWWYDPLTSQSVPIGTISGDFPVQAEFILRSAQQAALEVPYRINNDFGLTAISEAVRERMKAAGYSQSVEGYVLRTDDIQAK